ncbi:FtsX-like permease family protein [Flavobacterium sp. ZT3R18]|uniref:ABC transporter permease n=1 Tax=Flavobacterium sp. ZT3R18 TaxID=2594429 RepID=UPI00117A998F|nr:ABC transporter permease [Flavobacterium sp. ZT3R18]TRX35458.1 FtsX-like permease family protein [Flavobacterium sp. ZT3R18]
MLKNWTTIFLYHIKNNKLFTALNVLGLSIGIAGLIFALLYWNDEQSYNEWNLNKDNVFQAISKFGPKDYWASNVAPLEEYLKTDFKEIESHCYFDNWYSEEIIRYNSKKGIFKITNAQKTFFEMFPFNFIKGNRAMALKDNASIAISRQTAIELFGSEEALGKIVTYSEKKLVVRGVYIISGKSSMQPDAVVNLIDNRISEDKVNWGGFYYGLLLKIKHPNEKDKVIKKIEHLIYQNRVVKEAKKEGLSIEDWSEKNGVNGLKIILEPLKNARLHSVVEGFAEPRGNYQFLMIMVGLSILILILSIVNYINLATATAIKRAKEVGVRKVMGATKSNIVMQFLFETILITTFSILLSLVIVELSLPYYNDFLGKKLIISGNQFYSYLFLVFVITIIVAGIFPAIYVSNFETLKVLKGDFERSKSGVWLRNGMLIIQFAIATFFIIGSYIVYQQVKFISTKDLGFKGEQILSIAYRNDYNWKEEGYKQKLHNRYNMIKQEIIKIKGVEQLSTGAFSFGSENGSTSVFAYKNNKNISARNMGVDFGMLEMMQIKIKEGRFLSEKLASDTINSMLVNETALKMMNEKYPIGKVVDWNEHKFKIVGVVKDFNLFGPQEKIPPMVFFHFKTVDWMLQNVSKIHVKINSEDSQQTIAEIEKFWIKNVDAENPFSYDFVDKEYARTYESYVKQKNLFSLLNVVVIIIALFGLFALASYSIQRRMKEIAIRKTLGAETNVLLRELSKQYILYCIIGFLTALFPVYYLLNKWLENFAFRIDITVLPFVFGFVLLLVLTLIIVLSRAYHATKTDVLKYLKYE